VAPVTLPGAPSSPAFAQYSGYVEVNASAGANMFFWLVESQNDPRSDPVVLWLTGGP
jgi:carboxypeptidase C (cathepsin A)